MSRKIKVVTREGERGSFIDASNKTKDTQAN